MLFCMISNKLIIISKYILCSDIMLNGLIVAFLADKKGGSIVPFPMFSSKYLLFFKYSCSAFSFLIIVILRFFDTFLQSHPANLSQVLFYIIIITQTHFLWFYQGASPGSETAYCSYPLYRPYTIWEACGRIYTKLQVTLYLKENEQREEWHLYLLTTMSALTLPVYQ